MWMKMFALQISVGGGAQRWPSRVRALATGASSGGYDFLPNSWDSPSSWSPCDCESPHLVLLPFHGMGTEDLMCPTQPLPAPFAVYSLAPPSSRQRQGYEPAPSSRQSDVLIRQALETRVSFSSLLPQLHLCSSGGHGVGGGHSSLCLQGLWLARFRVLRIQGNFSKWAQQVSIFISEMRKLGFRVAYPKDAR